MRANSCTAGKKPLVVYAFVFMSAVSINGFVAGCDVGTQLKGVVLDSNDTPIPDAEVKLTTEVPNTDILLNARLVGLPEMCQGH
jgi:hypothetical protein